MTGILHQGLHTCRDARQKLSRRPWRVDNLDQLSQAWINGAQQADQPGSVVPSPYRRVVMFVDNAGADVVLGMIPLLGNFLSTVAGVLLSGYGLVLQCLAVLAVHQMSGGKAVGAVVITALVLIIALIAVTALLAFLPAVL